MTETALYWITRLDHIHGFLQLLIMLGLISGGFLALIGHNTIYAEDQKEATYRRWSLRLVLFCLLFLSPVLALIPTTKEMAAIKVLPILAKSDTVQDASGLGQEMVGLAREWIKTQRQEIEGHDE